MNFTSDDKIFLDTNILCYLYDCRDLAKQNRAQKIFNELLALGTIQISVQVLQEFCNVCLNKIHIPNEKVHEYLKLFAQLPVYLNDSQTILSALEIKDKTQFSFWDSLILVAAEETECNMLLSEDLNDGQVVNGLRIINPFK